MQSNKSVTRRGKKFKLASLESRAIKPDQIHERDQNRGSAMEALPMLAMSCLISHLDLHSMLAFRTVCKGIRDTVSAEVDKVSVRACATGCHGCQLQDQQQQEENWEFSRIFASYHNPSKVLTSAHFISSSSHVPCYTSPPTSSHDPSSYGLYPLFGSILYLGLSFIWLYPLLSPYKWNALPGVLCSSSSEPMHAPLCPSWTCTCPYAPSNLHVHPCRCPPGPFIHFITQ